MKFIARILMTVSAMAALDAHAEGLYIGGRLGSFHFNGDDVSGASTDPNSTGYKLYGGYRF